MLFLPKAILSTSVRAVSHVEQFSKKEQPRGLDLNAKLASL